MADRSVALTTVRGGINRQRTKGGAPQDQLYDALNCYVTKSKTIVVRPGTFRMFELPVATDLSDLTQGLTAFEGTLHVYADEEIDVPAGITLHIVQHPDATPETPIRIAEINFAKPFMGFIFLSATFENDDTYLYWLQTGDEWQAEHVYKLGDIVAPSVPNGLAFQAQRLTEPNIAWAPNITRALNDVIEPTVYNDFQYTVVDVQGANPRSGATEPVWPTEDGAQIIEDADGSAPTGSDQTVVPDPNATPAPATSDRYDNGLR